MRGYSVGLVGLILVATLGISCDSSTTSKRPLAQPVDDGRPQPQAPTPGEKPESTDPNAEAVITKLIAGHTKGHPEKLDQLKTFRSSRQGQFEGLGKAEWTIEAAWPDSFRQQTKVPNLGEGFNITARQGANGWKLLASQGMTTPTPLTNLETRAFRTDIFAEWMTVLVPLADPKARVASLLPEITIEDKPVDSIRIWIGDQMPVTLRVSRADSLLLRMEYEIVSENNVVPVTINFLARSEFQGVLLPTRSTYRVNNQPVSSWDSATFEFPVEYPKERFTKP